MGRIAHFRAHGASFDGELPWFRPDNPIEPAARGASEIRRVWWSALLDASSQ